MHGICGTSEAEVSGAPRLRIKIEMAFTSGLEAATRYEDEGAQERRRPRGSSPGP